MLRVVIFWPKLEYLIHYFAFFALSTKIYIVHALLLLSIVVT